MKLQWQVTGDVSIKPDLLNHLRNMEKELVVQAARAQVRLTTFVRTRRDTQRASRKSLKSESTNWNWC